eukprot:227466_1
MFRKLFGDDKKFDSTESADNAVSINEKKGTLAPNPKAMKTIREQFGRVLSVCGNPGSGKSTLTSTLYNIMRGDKRPYFEISDGMESFTRGIWALKDVVKAAHADKDSVYGWDVLDLEGLANSNAIHYLVVVALALSDAIALCGLKKRFNFDALKTIMAGLKNYRANNITLPTPTIYLQVPWVNYTGQKEFKISKNEKRDKDGFIAYIFERFGDDLQGVEIRLFATDFPDEDDDDYDEEDEENHPRFSKEYIQSVEGFLADLRTIPSKKVAIEQRVEYATQMVKALNDNSPGMIVKLNYKFFKDIVEQFAREEEASATLRIKQEGITVCNTIQDNLTFPAFCQKIGDGGKLQYGKAVYDKAITLSFYKESDAEINKLANKYRDDEKGQGKYYVSANPLCKDSYKLAIANVKSHMTTKGNELQQHNETNFRSFVNVQVETAMEAIQFQGSLSLPWKVTEDVREKRAELKKEIIEKTQNLVELPKDFLNDDILKSKWDTAVNTKKAQWAVMKTSALGEDKRKVITAGNHTCGKCGKKHGNGVTDLKCQDSLYYWVDAQTKYCICDTCHKLWKAGTIVCASSSCKAPLDVRVIPIN